MKITKHTAITKDLAKAINSLDEASKQKVVDSLTMKQTEELFEILFSL